MILNRVHLDKGTRNIRTEMNQKTEKAGYPAFSAFWFKNSCWVFPKLRTIIILLP